jgi:DNA mismatch endonuclease (patch repair protein)
MRSQKERDTAPEVSLRRELRRLGLGYRLHLRAVAGTRREIDIAFPGPRVAVFVDGCFWHGCPDHGSTPGSNSDWWRSKLEANRRRDEDTSRRLEDEDWVVVRVWEHQNMACAASGIAAVLAARRACPRGNADDG